MTTVIQNKQVEHSDINLKVNLAGADLDLKWDSFLSSHPEGTIYHHPSWLKVIEEESGQEILKLVCTNNENEIVGIFPLQKTKGFPFGLGGVPSSKRLSSLPRTPIGGPLTTDEFATDKLIEEAINIVSENPDQLLQIKSYSTDLNKSVEVLKKHFWREIYIKEIPPHPDEIRFGNSRNHAAIASSLEVLSVLLTQVAQTPLCLLLTARPEFVAPWDGSTPLTQVELQRLDTPQIEHMIANVTDGRTLPTEVREQIVAKTDGIPLFVVPKACKLLLAWRPRKTAIPIGARLCLSSTWPGPSSSWRAIALIFVVMAVPCISSSTHVRNRC